MILRKSWISLFVGILTLAAPRSHAALTLERFGQPPRLVVLLVIDQFRSDFLTRLEKKFAPPGTTQAPGGFRFLMKNGAYYPFAEFGALQNMTCPGHATISTGSNPATFGFSSNEWFDPIQKKSVYCAEDPTFDYSPIALKTTTFGDELRTLYPKSRVIGIAIKDRSAIMLAGHKASQVIWFDGKTGRWVTSKYYNKGETPKWVLPLNDAISKEKNAPPVKGTLEGSIRGVKLTFDAALAAVTSEKLGRGPSPDVLAVSLSTHDMLGHATGPTTPVMEALTLAEDKALSDFLKKLSKELGGLDRVVFALSADHGIPPQGEEYKGTHLKSGQIDFLDVTKKIYQTLDRRFGSAGKQPWLLSMSDFQFHLNQELIQSKSLKAAEVENEIRNIVEKEPGVATVFTRGDYEAGRFPPGFIGQQLKNSYVPEINGDLIIVPKPFFTDKTHHSVTHITGYSYDRTVPVIVMGKNIRPGVYSGARIIDIAPTLSFLLRVLPPAKNEGRVLQEIF